MTHSPDELIARREAVKRHLQLFALDIQLVDGPTEHQAIDKMADAILTTLEASDADTASDMAEVERLIANWRKSLLHPARWIEDLRSLLTAAHPKPEPVETQPVDSGMNGEAVERAEWFWASLPTGRKWTSLATHEKAHTCEATMAAWKRVGEAALAYLETSSRNDRRGCGV